MTEIQVYKDFLLYMHIENLKYRLYNDGISGSLHQLDKSLSIKNKMLD